MPRRYVWARWPISRLMQLRIARLGLTLEGTWLEQCVERLYEELDAKGIRLRPHVWLSDEWFAPSTAPGFAIPFYLAHPRLMRLERSQIFDVEGDFHCWSDSETSFSLLTSNRRENWSKWNIDSSLQCSQKNVTSSPRYMSLR